MPLQLLSETGLPGLVLGLAFVAGLGLGLRATVGRLEPGERAAAVGLLALPVAFGLHALVDYDLDFLAVAAPTALVSAALLGAGRPAALARSKAARRRSARCSARGAAIWVLAAPALATRSIDAAYRHGDAGELKAAASAARRAQSLNPLSPEPLFARATIAGLAGDERGRGGVPTSRRRGCSRRTRTPGTSSASSASSPSATSAAPTSRSMPPTRSIRAAAASRRAGHWISRGPRWTTRRIRPAGGRGCPDDRLKPVAAQEPTTTTAWAPCSCDGAQAVERADDADAEVAGEPAALSLEALAVHHEAAREVGARRVRDAADAIAAARDARGRRRCGALAAVAVEDEHRDLPAREVRGRRRGDAMHLRTDAASLRPTSPPRSWRRDGRRCRSRASRSARRRRRRARAARRPPRLRRRAPPCATAGSCRSSCWSETSTTLTFARGRRAPSPAGQAAGCSDCHVDATPVASDVSARKPIAAAARSPSSTLRPSSPARAASWTGSASEPATRRQTS